LTKVDTDIIIKAKPDCFLVSVPAKSTWQDVGNSVSVKLNPSWLRDVFNPDKVVGIGLLVDVNAS
jgi:hypothetical protein